MKRVWRRRWVVLAAIALCAVPLANVALQQAAVAFLSSLVDQEVAIGVLRVGFGRLSVEALSVQSRGCPQPLLYVDSISVGVTPWAGIRRGTWLGQVNIDQPSVQLHFSADGTLLTDLPVLPSSDSDSEPMSSFPIRKLVVSNAHFAVHQVGRQSFSVERMGLIATATPGGLDVTAVIPELFSAECRLDSSIDLPAMTAETRVKLAGMRLSSTQLASLPLTHTSLGDQPCTVAASMDLEQDGSLSDLSCNNAMLTIRELKLTADRPSPDRPSPIVDLVGNATATNGRIKIDVSGQSMGGPVAFDGRLAVEPGGLQGQASLSLQGANTDSLPPGLIPPGIQSAASTETKISLSLSQELVRLLGEARITVDETELYGVTIAPTHIDATIDGAIDLREEPHRSQGGIYVTAASEGVAVDQLVGPEIRRLPAIDGAPTLTPTQRAKPLRISHSVDLTGRVRGAARLSVPLATLTDPATFQIDGQVDATGVVVNDVEVRSGIAKLQLESGTAVVDCPEVRFYDRVLESEFSLRSLVHSGLDANSSLRAELQLNEFPAATAARLAGVTGDEVTGTFSVNASASCPVSATTNVDRWLGALTFRGASILVNDEPVADCIALCELAGGQLTLRELTGNVADGVLAGRGVVQLKEPFAFQGDLALRQVDVGRLARAANRPPWTSAGGQLTLSSEASGEFASQQWKARGTLVGSDLQVRGRPIAQTRLDFEASPRTVRVASPPSGFLEGDLLVTASLPAKRQGSGVPQIEGRLSGVPLPAIARLAGFSRRVDGLVSCEFTAVCWQDLNRLTVSAVAHSDHLTVQDTPIRNIEGRVNIESGMGRVELAATALDGLLSLEASSDIRQLAALSPEQWQDFGHLPVEGTAQFTDAKMHRAWPALGQQTSLRPLKGTVSVRVERGEAEYQAGTIAKADVVVRDLRWDNVLWSNQLRALMAFSPKLIEVYELSGPFARGRLAGRGKVTLDAAKNGTFELSAAHVALDRALAPIDRRGGIAKGLASLRVQGQLGRRPAGRALVSIDRGEVGPVEVASLRLPIDWSINPRSKTIQWRTTNAGLGLGGGRVVTNAHGRWNGKLDMSLVASARGVDTGRVLKSNGAKGGGFLDGTVRLTARRASQPQDLLGTFDATLSDAQSLQLPVLSEMTAFLGSLPTNTSFDESRIKGRLGNGIVHLDRVTLSAANARILVEGTATLKGRLDLEVMAKTNETGPADKLLELADSPLLLAAPAPVALVAKANDALKDRVIHLRVGGTTARPAVRLEPGRQLGQEAIKFFMNQTIAFGKRPDVESF